MVFNQYKNSSKAHLISYQNSPIIYNTHVLPAQESLISAYLLHKKRTTKQVTDLIILLNNTANNRNPFRHCRKSFIFHQNKNNHTSKSLLFHPNEQPMILIKKKQRDPRSTFCPLNVTYNIAAQIRILIYPSSQQNKQTHNQQHKKRQKKFILCRNPSLLRKNKDDPDEISP